MTNDARCRIFDFSIRKYKPIQYHQYVAHLLLDWMYFVIRWCDALIWKNFVVSDELMMSHHMNAPHSLPLEMTNRVRTKEIDRLRST